MTFRPQRPDWTILLITLTAFGLRIWQLADVPPGWRDDELINVFVISQKILDGQLAFFYPDASGHEPLYHALHAIFIALFGTNALGFRLLSAIFGTLAVPLTYHLGRRFFSRHHGLIAAAALSVSFWSLIYSRLGMRHMSLTVWTLLAFICFWRAQSWRALQSLPVAAPIASWRRRLTQYGPFMGAAFFTSLGFYTYFAGRGVPLILLAFCLYLALWQRPLLRAHWRGIVLMFGLIALLALPLAVTLWQQPKAQGRVSELAVPLTAARVGDLTPLAQQTATTLRMFHADGDPEWLYNIPHRPVLGIIGAAFLWVGVGLALFQGARFSFSAERRRALPYVFLLGWWAAGIFPGFISVPPASFGHTILAQPATFLLAALPIGWIAGQRWAGGHWLAALLGALLVISVGWRDLPAYFTEWPAHGNTRFLYHANMRDVAEYAAAHPNLADFGVSDLLAGPWSRLALQIELAAAGADAQPRLYDPQRAIFPSLAGRPAVSFHGYPQVPDAYAAHYGPPLAQAGGYTLASVAVEPLPPSPLACFQNGLCALAAAYDPATSVLEITWQVAHPLELPPIPIISNPPPPGVYAGPRLWTFAHLVDDSGRFLSGDDGFWVDPQTLRAGDVFRQRHILPLPDGVSPAAVHFGLYDPYTGERVRGDAGIDHIPLPLP
ncbi:MAG: hypothetical protein Fur0021_36030 [Candidatus Promineifilaceae bacterium]